jgi:hypothetical protein
MKLKFVASIFSALVATSGLAVAQHGDSPPNGSKPTKADVQKVVQIISSDKAKTRTYCDLNKLYDQMQREARQPRCLRKTRRGGLRPTWRSCWCWCVKITSQRHKVSRRAHPTE